MADETTPTPPPTLEAAISPASAAAEVSAAPWRIAAWSRGIMFQYFGSLLMEANGGGRYVLSLGRVALLALLGQSMYVWHGEREISGSMKEVLFALLAYNFGTKGASLAKDMIEAWKAGKAPEQQ